MITTIQQYRLLRESSGLRFENLHIDHHNQQHNYRLKAYAGDTLVAHIDYVEFRDEYHIHMIEADVKGQGYGRLIILELARMYGYENIYWDSLTKDGAKLQARIDAELNFDREAWSKDHCKHLSKNDTIDVIKAKYPKVAAFMSDLCLFGTDAWDRVDVGVCSKLLSKTGVDLNDVADIASWIKGSATNNHSEDAEVPHAIKYDLSKLIN